MDEPLWDASQTGSMVHQSIDDEWIPDHLKQSKGKHVDEVAAELVPFKCC